MADCFWTELEACVEDCDAGVLLKPFQPVFIPSIRDRLEQFYDKRCPSQGGGWSGGSSPAPGQRCVRVPVYGPPTPALSGGGAREGGAAGPTIIGYQTTCV